MKDLTSLFTLTLVLLVTAAAPALAQHDDTDKHVHHAGMHDAATQPEIVDGVQVVEITVAPRGYSVDRIDLKAGIPTRLVFTRTVDGGCVGKVQAPDLGIEKTPLPLGEPVAIEFTPTESGEYSFACGMGMLEGMLLVKA